MASTCVNSLVLALIAIASVRVAACSANRMGFAHSSLSKITYRATQIPRDTHAHTPMSPRGAHTVGRYTSLHIFPILQGKDKELAKLVEDKKWEDMTEEERKIYAALDKKLTDRLTSFLNLASVLTTITILVIFVGNYADLPGEKPMDLGVTPQHTLRDCSPNTVSCLSSFSTDPAHYYPPFRYTCPRKQAYDDLKSVLETYRPGTGGVDKGGFELIQYTDTYFYAQGKSLVWGFVDDLELLFDDNEPVVHVRSSSRPNSLNVGSNSARLNALGKTLVKKGASNQGGVFSSRWEFDDRSVLSDISNTVTDFINQRIEALNL